MIYKTLIFAAFLLSLIIFQADGVNAQESTEEEAVPSKQAVEIYKNDLRRIEDYLNGITTLVASFIQTDSEGERSDGVFYLARPGRLRWEYYPPTPVLIIAKGSILTYYDSELNQVSHIGLDDNISGFLTRKNISFSEEEIEIIRFTKENGRIEVTIAQKGREEEGQLTMIFNDEKIELIGMNVLDAIGKITYVTFSTVVYDKPLESSLFVLPKIRKK